MTDVRIENGLLVVEPIGWHKLWSVKRQMRVPLEHVSAARADPREKIGWPSGIRAPGTFLPGVIAAGSYYSDGWTFWDVSRPRNIVVIDLNGEPYKQLVIDVAEPEKIVESLHAAIPGITHI